MKDGSALSELQALDQSLADLKVQANRRAGSDERDRALRDLKTATALAKKTDEALAAARDQLRSLERELETVQGAIVRAEKQLGGGEVNDPKELSALQDRIQSLGRSRDEKETEYLMSLDAVQAAEAGAEAARERRDRLEKEAKDRVAKWRQAEIGAKEQLETKSKEREQLLARLPDELRQAYEEAREVGKGIALTRIIQGACEACHLSLPAEQLDVLESSVLGTGHCPHCGRIVLSVERPS